MAAPLRSLGHRWGVHSVHLPVGPECRLDGPGLLPWHPAGVRACGGVHACACACGCVRASARLVCVCVCVR